MTTHKLSFSHTALKDFANCPLAFYHKRILKDVAFVQSDSARWGEEVHKHFENRVKGEAELPFTLAAFEPVLSKFDGKEVKTEFMLCVNESLQPTDWFADDAWIRCIVDVGVWLSPTEVWLGDYKTGKRRPDFDQLKLSSLLLWQHYPEIQKCTTSFLWTQDKKLDTEVFHRSDANKLWEEVISKIRRIYKARDSEQWPARPSGLCNYCDVRKQKGCTYAR